MREYGEGIPLCLYISVSKMKPKNNKQDARNEYQHTSGSKNEVGQVTTTTVKEKVKE
jgi:hypothetical protein